MRYAMIAKLINDEMEPVATIDVGKKGFTFETKDDKLKKILESVQKNGVEFLTGGHDKDGNFWDKFENFKINEDNISLLINEIEKEDYVWWEDLD